MFRDLVCWRMINRDHDFDNSSLMYHMGNKMPRLLVEKGKSQGVTATACSFNRSFLMEWLLLRN